MDDTTGFGFHNLWLWLLILALLATLYLPSLKFDLSCDDFCLYGRRDLGRAFVDYLLKGQRPGLTPDEYTHFRPLSVYLWGVNFALFGPRIGYYHAEAALICLLNMVLVFFVARKALRLDRTWSQCASLMFAVFWANFEAVGRLSANNTIICMTFMLSAVLFSVAYVRRGGISSLVGLTVSIVLAIASKEFALVMPFVLVLIWYLPFDRPLERAKKRSITAVIISAVLVACYWAVRSSLGFRGAIQQDSFTAPLRSGIELLAMLWCPKEHLFFGVLSAVFILLSLFERRTRVLALMLLALLSPALIRASEPRHEYPASVAFALLLALVLKGLEKRPYSKTTLFQAGLLAIMASGALHAFLMQKGPSIPIVMGALAAAIIILACARIRGSLAAPSFAPLILLSVIVAGNLGLAMDFPWQFTLGGKARSSATELIEQLPKGDEPDAPLTIAVTNSVFIKDGRRIPVGYVRIFAVLLTGRDIDFIFIEDVLEKIASAPDTDISDLVVIGQLDGKIRRLTEVEGLLRLRQASYLELPPNILSFAFNAAPDESDRRFVACEVDGETVGCLDMRDEPLSSVSYDLVSVGFVRPNDLPTQTAWLEWYQPGSQSPAGRALKEINAGQATFLLRRDLHWLAAGRIGKITTGFVGEDAVDFLGAICIRAQPATRLKAPLESDRPRLRRALNKEALKRSGAIPGDE